MIDVLMEEEDVLQLLNERVGFWSDDPITCELFEMYYSRMLDEGCFDGARFDVREIVDNDYINWMSVITEDEFENYHIMNEYDDRIEASIEDNSETYFLIRN